MTDYKYNEKLEKQWWWLPRNEGGGVVAQGS